MDRLCADHDATAGAVNCHGDALRWNPGVGITACLGVALCTQGGRPFSCTGDIPTGRLGLRKQMRGGLACPGATITQKGELRTHHESWLDVALSRSVLLGHEEP